MKGKQRLHAKSLGNFRIPGIKTQSPNLPKYVGGGDQTMHKGTGRMASVVSIATLVTILYTLMASKGNKKTKTKTKIQTKKPVVCKCLYFE